MRELFLERPVDVLPVVAHLREDQSREVVGHTRAESLELSVRPVKRAVE